MILGMICIVCSGCSYVTNYASVIRRSDQSVDELRFESLFICSKLSFLYLPDLPLETRLSHMLFRGSLERLLKMRTSKTL